MKCKYCNGEQDGNNRFCIFCGHEIEAEPETKKKKLKPIFIVLIIVGALQLLSVIALVVFFVLSYIFGFGNSLSFDGIFGAKKDEAIIDHNQDNTYDDDSYGDNYYEYDTLPSFDETAPVYSDTESEDTEELETEPVETEPPLPQHNSSERVVIANGGLNMRSNPGTSSSIVTLIPNGSMVTVEKVEGNWAYVHYSGNYGWCSCDYLFVPVEYFPTCSYTAKVICNGNLEMESYDYAEKDIVYTDVPNGTMVYVYEIIGDRALIKYNNIYGWCSIEYLDIY